MYFVVAGFSSHLIYNESIVLYFSRMSLEIAARDAQALQLSDSASRLALALAERSREHTAIVEVKH